MGLTHHSRRDANHADVRDGLRDDGHSVLDLGAVGDGCPDLLVATGPTRTFLIEVKDGKRPPSERQLTPAQSAFFLSWKGEKYVVTSLSMARAAVLKGK